MRITVTFEAPDTTNELEIRDFVEHEIVHRVLIAADFLPTSELNWSYTIGK